MNFHNIGLYEEISKISFYYHQIRTLSVLLQSAVVVIAGLSFCIGTLLVAYEPLPEKTGFLHMRKQRHRSASR